MAMMVRTMMLSMMTMTWNMKPFGLTSNGTCSDWSGESEPVAVKRTINYDGDDDDADDDEDEDVS